VSGEQERWDSGWKVHVTQPILVIMDDKPSEEDYWLSRHWAVPSCYSPEDWYENEAKRMAERAPA
jgi:hypothetical protein